MDLVLLRSKGSTRSKLEVISGNFYRNFFLFIYFIFSKLFSSCYKKESWWVAKNKIIKREDFDHVTFSPKREYAEIYEYCLYDWGFLIWNPQEMVGKKGIEMKLKLTIRISWILEQKGKTTHSIKYSFEIKNVVIKDMFKEIVKIAKNNCKL